MQTSYSFEVLRQKIAIVVSLSYFLFVFVLMTIIGIYTQQAGLTITLFFGMLIIPIIFYRKLIPVRKETVILEKNGFFLESQNRFIEWESIIWQKTEFTQTTLAETIEFGVLNDKNANFPYYKKSRQQNDWIEFKKDILRLTDENCPNMRDYYDTKSWRILKYTLIASWFVIPFVLISLNLDVRKIIPIVMIYIGSTIPLIITISNKKRKK